MKKGGNTQEIQEEFTQLMTVEDVVALINLAKSDIFGESCKPITIKQFNYHRYSSLNKNRYSSFSIKKKSGGERIIYAPNSGLKVIQTCLNYIFQLCYSPSNSAYGFVEDKSVVDNARQHIGQNYIYNIDLKDFFLSIEAGRIYKRLQVKPFELSKKVASAITDICCHKMGVERKNKDGMFVKTTRNVLPQGAPTSPILTNIVCERLDRKLLKLATNFNLKYTRYADDITFSGYYNAFEDASDFIQNMKKIIAEEGFFINEKKTRLQKHNVRQEVTGLVVSKDRVNVPKKYIKDLRGILFCWEKYGEEEVLKRFTPRYKEEKGHIKKGEPDIKNVVSGKLLYLRMVKGADNNTYQNLQARFDKLCGINPNQFLEDILTIWEKQGIDAAMKKYYKKDSDKETEFSTMEYKSFISEVLDKQGIANQVTDQMVDLLVGKKELRQISKEVMFEACKKLWEENESLKKISQGGSMTNGKKYYHNPHHMVSFLYQFSKNDSYKWYTHAPDATDQDFDYEAYMENAKKGFQDIAKGISQYTWKNVSNFIFDTEFAAKDSYNNDIKFRWKDLRAWCMEHKFRHPYYKLVDDYKFERYITIFKNTIEFRTDDNNLTFANRIEDFMYDYVINSPDISLRFLESFYSIGGSLRVYVDVRQLFTAFIEMGKWIVSNKSKSNKVEFSLTEAEDRYVFSIFHKGSYMNIDDEKLKGLSGDFHKIRNILLNVVDWTIEADVKGIPLQIVCLDSQTEYKLNEKKKAVVSTANQLNTVQQKIGGVKHIVTLYKNIQS